MARSSIGVLLLASFYLFLDRSVLGKDDDITCGFPGTPAYGNVKPDSAGYSEGDVVSYSCRVGYILIGSPISRCTDDGSWTEDVPICDDSMTTLGVAFSTPTVPGHSAEMAIDRDKETCSYLKPKTPRWWRIDLGDEHKVLSVAVTMISPDKYVKFTVFVIKTQGTSASYKRCASFSGKFGTQTVVLACEKGKGIQGQRVHIEDHNQMEGLFEICEVEVQVEKDTGYDCGRPSRQINSITFEPEGDEVEYGCITGYEIKGDDVRTCQNNGQWSGEAPECEPIICDELEPLENGQTKLSVVSEGTPLEGAIAIYKCDEGYKLIGSFTRHCKKDGSWSESHPQCKAIRCPIPDGKGLGGIYRLLNKTNSMGSMAELKCKRGAKMEGENPYITCTEDGEWTNPENKAYCILPNAAAFERSVQPRIVNHEAIIFGMVVAAFMIVVVLVSLYLYTQRRRLADKPELPIRQYEPPEPPPRPPPRSKSGTFKTALMGLIARDSQDKGDENDLSNDKTAWKTQSLPPDHPFAKEEEKRGKSGGLSKKALSCDEPLQDEDEPKPAVIEVEVLAQDDATGKGRNLIYSSVPEENEDANPEDVVVDIEEKGSRGAPSPTKGTPIGAYAEVDYDKKRQSRLLKEQDSMESSSTAGASPLPVEEPESQPDSPSPTPPKRLSRSETEETEESEASEPHSPKPRSPEARAEEQAKAEAEEAKRKEAEEQQKKEEEERKAKEAAKKKEEEAAATGPGSRRRRLRAEEPPPPVEERPVLRRVRRL